MSLLIVAAELAQAQTLADRLRAAGLKIAGASSRHMLVHEAVRIAPEAVAVLADALDEGWQQSLALLADAAPRPVLLLVAARLPAQADALAGLQAWLPGPVDAQAVADAQRWAVANHGRLRRLQAELAGAQTRLDERKWVDRAKGLLMRDPQVGEPAAFALLRAAAMQGKLRLGEVSRGLVEAALAADAVNRAGQLRMLSQRIVKLLALRSVAAGPARDGERWLADSVQRAQANLAALSALDLDPALAGLLQAANERWMALASTLPGADPAASVADAGGATPAVASGDQATAPARDVTAAAASGPPPAAATNGAEPLARADERAEALLAAADALTDALQRASGRPQLALVNLCGRQRMLSQRLAKQALLAGLLGGARADAQAAAAALTMADFESALLQLERAPLSTPAIRAALAAARGQWLRLRAGIPRQGGGAPAVARESEALLASFEELTSLVEHSMQLLLG